MNYWVIMEVGPNFSTRQVFSAILFLINNNFFGIFFGGRGVEYNTVNVRVYWYAHYACIYVKCTNAYTAQMRILFPLTLFFLF